MYWLQYRAGVNSVERAVELAEWQARNTGAEHRYRSEQGEMAAGCSTETKFWLEKRKATNRNGKLLNLVKGYRGNEGENQG